MEDQGSYSPPAAELADAEVELPEWDRLRVRDYWDAVIAEELGARQSPASPYAWSEPGDAAISMLRLVTDVDDSDATSWDEAA
jgi:hypothetical protein